MDRVFDFSRLKPRETEVAIGYALGLTRKAIGDILGISSSTIGTHTQRMFKKLGIPFKNPHICPHSILVRAVAEAGLLKDVDATYWRLDELLWDHRKRA